MPPARFAIVCVAVTVWLCLACGSGHGGPTSPSGPGGRSATFTDEGGRFAGANPAPVTVGLTFSPVPASFPQGVSRTIVPMPDGRFRMYYFSDSASIEVVSAVSSDGLNWTPEAGVRYSDPGLGIIRAVAVPTGGVRVYYPNGIDISSLFSNDGLTFFSEGSVAITPGGAAFSWGPSAVAYVNGQFHMVLTRTPSSSGISELWHATSSDGRTWTVDAGPLAANPGVPLNQPAWGIKGGTLRIYYRAQLSSGNVIGSGIIMF